MALDFITHLATSSIGGGIFGVVKVGLDYWASYKKQKEVNAHEVQLETIRSQNKINEFTAGLKIEEEKTKQKVLEVDIAKEDTLQEEQRTFGMKAEADASVLTEQEKTKQGFIKSALDASSVAFVSTGNALRDFFQNITVISRAWLLFVLTVYILALNGFIFYWILYILKIGTDIEILKVLLQENPLTLAIVDAFVGTVNFFIIDRGGGKLLDRFSGISTPTQKKK